MVFTRRTAAPAAVVLIPPGVAATGFALADSPGPPRVPPQVELDSGSPTPTSTAPSVRPEPTPSDEVAPMALAEALVRGAELPTDATERALRMIVLGTRLPVPAHNRFSPPPPLPVPTRGSAPGGENRHVRAEVSGTQRPSTVR